MAAGEEMEEEKMLKKNELGMYIPGSLVIGPCIQGSWRGRLEPV